MSACVQPISCEAQRHLQACRWLTTAAGHSQLSSIADSPLSEVTGCTQPKAESNCLLASVHFLSKPPRTWSYIVAFACCIE